MDDDKDNGKLFLKATTTERAVVIDFYRFKPQTINKCLRTRPHNGIQLKFEACFWCKKSHQLSLLLTISE